MNAGFFKIMAQCKSQTELFIQHVFSPMVAVLASPLAEEIAKKNNLSFVELLRPYTKLKTEAYLRDPAGGQVPIKDLHLTLKNVTDRTPHSTVARKLLNSSVSDAPDPGTSTVSVGSYELEIPPSVPWFESWRETFLRVQSPFDHEFTKHFVGCIIVIASTEENPAEKLKYMNQVVTQLQSMTPPKLPTVINGFILKYNVLLHDNTDCKRAAAEPIYKLMNETYGTDNCFLLAINSRDLSTCTDKLPTADPWAPYVVKPVIEGLDEGDGASTPTDISSVSSMPNEVVTDANDDVMKTSIEMGQEANEPTIPHVTSASVTSHPLSPDTETDKPDDDINTSNSLTNLWSRANISGGNFTQHGMCLTPLDIEQICAMIQEFCLQALIPYVKYEIQKLTDLISNKKGVSRSLLTATKRWFGGTKQSCIYLNDSAELYTRRLGDLYFMFGHYSMAYQTYHSVKRDFKSDEAFLYYAGALEMAALSAFMDGKISSKYRDYMEESIITYLNQCRKPQLATRATLLSAEILKQSEKWGEAAKQLIRMTSEESDLRSALLLEQAAYCFLRCKRPPMARKYAFHVVLAGHRFSKAGQRKHSLRCYKQAFQVYMNKGWNLAEDHIYFTIGRQASNLKMIPEAVDSFSKLVNASSQQSAEQQFIFLREFISTHTLLENQDGTAAVLPLPIVDGNLTKVLLTPPPLVTTPGKSVANCCTFSTDLCETVDPRWVKLEEMLVREAQGTMPMILKPWIPLYSNLSNNTTKPLSVVAETVAVSVSLFNPLKVSLVIDNLQLLWSLTKPDTENTISNETSKQSTDKFVHTMKMKPIILQAESRQEIILTLTPLMTGNLNIKGIMYRLGFVSLPNIPQSSESDSGLTNNTSILGKQLIQVHGRKLKIKERNGRGQTYAPDFRLDINVIQAAPCLQVTFSVINKELLCGEIQPVTVDFVNHGRLALTNVHMTSTTPHLISYRVKSSKRTDRVWVNQEKDKRKRFVTRLTLPPEYNDCLKPGQTYSFVIHLQAPQKKGPLNIDILIYYENTKDSLPKYRLVRHTWHLTIQDSLRHKVLTQTSPVGYDREKLNISTQLTNANQIFHAVSSEIYLLRVSLLSHRWKLLNNKQCPDDTKMSIQESVDVVLRAYKNIVPDDQIPNCTDVSLATVADVNQTVPDACVDFLYRSGDAIVLLTEEDDPSKRQKPEGILIILWYANVSDNAGNKRKAIGQHFVRIEPVVVNVQSNNILALTRNKESRYLTFSIKCWDVINHDFSKHKVCIVPVTLHLFSCDERELDVKIKTLKDRNRHENTSRSGFQYVGLTGGNVIKLSCNGRVEVPLKAAFVKSGTFDLTSRLEIYCQPSKTATHSGYVLQTCDLLTMVIVK